MCVYTQIFPKAPQTLQTFPLWHTPYLGYLALKNMLLEDLKHNAIH